MKKPTALILSTYFNKGGAAIAATRLWHSLQKYTAFNINFLHVEPSPHRPDEGIYSRAPAFLLQKQWWAKFIAEELSMRFLLQKKEDWFQFSLAPWGMALHRHPLVQQADIIHLHWVNDAFLSLHALRSMSTWHKPVVVTMHDMWTFTGGCHYSGACEGYRGGCVRCPKVRRPFHAMVQNHRQSKSSVWQQFRAGGIRWVGCSRWLADCARAAGILHATAIRHIPNPINTDLFRYLPQQQARDTLQLPHDRFILLCGAASLNDRRKGMDILWEALRRLEQEQPETAGRLLLCTFGKTADFEAFKKIEHKHLGSFRDPAALNRLYAAADAYVLTSRQDNLPNTIMEAMASGTPVLATPVGGIPEMIAHMHNGYLMRDLSPEACVDGILFLMKQAATLRPLARQWVEKHYAEAIVARQYAELYEELLQLKR